MERIQVFEAASSGDLSRVKFLIEEKGVPVSITNEKKKTIAQVAVRNNNLEILEYVQAKDPSLLTKTDDQNSTLLHLAVERGALDIVKYLVEKRVANVFDTKYVRDGKLNITETALHRAVRCDHQNIIKYFIEERKVDVNLPTVDQVEPLHFLALRCQKTQTFTYLVEEAKAKLDVLNSNKENILFLAVEQGNLDLMKDLLDQKKVSLPINWTRFDGKTLVHIAVLKNQIEALNYLVEEKNADVNVADTDKNMPLHYATLKEDEKAYEYSKYLIMHGADINRKNILEKTPISKKLPFDVVFHDDFDFLKYLFEIKKMKFDINNDRWDGWTLIESALKWNQSPKMVQYLVNERHADLSTSQIFESLAFVNDYYDLKLDVTALKRSDESGNTLLHKASVAHHSRLCEYLVKQGSDINQKNNKGETPLLLAVSKDSQKVCEFLVEEGANIDEMNNEGETPLHCAASQGRQKICEFLIEHGANINQKNNNSKTPLHLALSSNQQDIFTYLANHNASTDDIHGTPLIHMAAKLNQITVLHYLVVEKHVDVNLCRKIDSWTPLHCAAFGNCSESFQYLIEHGANIKAKDVYGKTPLEVVNDEQFIQSVKNILEKRTRRRVHEFSPTYYYTYPNPNHYDQLRIIGNIHKGVNKCPTDILSDINATKSQNFLLFFYLVVRKCYSPIRTLSIEEGPILPILQYRMDPVVERAIETLPNFT